MRKIFSGRSSVIATLAAGGAIVVLAGGGAVAGSLVTSAQIKNNTIQGVDVKTGTLTGSDIKNNSITGADVKGSSLAGSDIHNGTLTGADVKDGSLTNQDVGVLWAQVNDDATVAGSSGGVTALRPSGTGSLEVDFGRDITACAFTATVGDATAGSSTGLMTQATDRSGNTEAVYISTTDAAGAAANKPVQLIVVC